MRKALVAICIILMLGGVLAASVLQAQKGDGGGGGGSPAPKGTIPNPRGVVRGFGDLVSMGGSVIWLVVGAAFLVAFVMVGKSIYGMMHIASRNLLSKKSMTALALIGLVLGVATIVALVSVSTGIQGMIEERTGESKGIMILEKDSSLGPMWSTVSMSDLEKIEKIAGVRNVCPRVIFIAKSMDGKFTEAMDMSFTSGMIIGVEPEKEARKRVGVLTTSGTITRGRYLTQNDGKAVVIGTKLAKDINKAVGSVLKINGEKFKVVGIFDTGIDQTNEQIMMPIAEAQELDSLASDKARGAFVETDDPNAINRMASLIEAKISDVQAISTEEFADLLGGMMANIEAFLWAISAIAGIVAGVNIVNTMLMSIMEREQELGVMRAIGWTQDDIIMLVMAESVLLGIVGGVLGVAVGIGIVEVAKVIIDIPMLVDLPLAFNACIFALAVGSLGGLYPAWRASRMNPLEAIQGE